MIYTIENEYLQVKVSSKGAELQSVFYKKNQKEYLWNGIPEVWNRRAPILFPIVGRLIDNSYIYKNKTYTLPQHGFARDLEFDEILSSETEITFILTDSEKTIENYPFTFVLFVSYKLEGTKVVVEYQIKNTDVENPMYYSIGGHPGFTLHDPEKEPQINDLQLKFEKVERFETHVLDGPYRSGEKKSLIAKENILPLGTDTFEGDALIFKDLKSNHVVLENKSTKRSIRFDFGEFDWLGIWSRFKNERFICIEPWMGVCDQKGKISQLENKEGIKELKPNGTDTYKYSFEIVS